MHIRTHPHTTQNTQHRQARTARRWATESCEGSTSLPLVGAAAALVGVGLRQAEAEAEVEEGEVAAGSCCSSSVAGVVGGVAERGGVEGLEGAESSSSVFTAAVAVAGGKAGALEGVGGCSSSSSLSLSSSSLIGAEAEEGEGGEEEDVVEAKAGRALGGLAACVRKGGWMRGAKKTEVASHTHTHSRTPARCPRRPWSPPPPPPCLQHPQQARALKGRRKRKQDG